MKFCLIVVLCIVAGAQCDEQCNYVTIVVEEGLALVQNAFEETKLRNIEPYLNALTNTTAPLVEFKDKLKDIVKEYMNQSCVMESMNKIDASVDEALHIVDEYYKPKDVIAIADSTLGGYNEVIAHEIKKQTASLDAYVKEHNMNLTCYLEIFREGYRNVTYLFNNVIPDYLNNFAKEIGEQFAETTKKMDYWAGTINAGVEDCKTKPFTPFCIAALLQEKTPKLVKDTDLGGLLIDTKINYTNGLEGEKMNAIQIIAMTFQKIFNALSIC
ncbi:unnamed protein product [Diamesa tonsa]